MKSVLGQGQVQPAGSNMLGNALGALANTWGESYRLASKEQSQMRLADYKHQLGLERDANRNITNTVATMAQEGIAHHFKTIQQENDKKNKIEVAKNQESQKRRTKSHGAKVDLRTMKDMTKGLHIAAGLEYPEGAISPMVRKAGEYQGQLQALAGHPLLGANPATTPRADKSAGGKKAKTTANPTPAATNNPVPPNLANPFQTSPNTFPTPKQVARKRKLDAGDQTLVQEGGNVRKKRVGEMAPATPPAGAAANKTTSKKPRTKKPTTGTASL